MELAAGEFVMREFLVAPRIGLQVAVTLALGYGAYRLWPDDGAAWYHYIGSAIFIGGTLYFGIPATLQVIKYHVQVRRKRKARHAEKNPRDACFATEKEIEAAGLFNPNNGGVPVGLINGRPFFYPFTHALCNAPAGTSKTIACVLPAIVHGYRIPGKNKNESHAASAIILDLKRELKAMTKRSRE